MAKWAKWNYFQPGFLPGFLNLPSFPIPLFIFECNNFQIHFYIDWVNIFSKKKKQKYFANNSTNWFGSNVNSIEKKFFTFFRTFVSHKTESPGIDEAIRRKKTAEISGIRKSFLFSIEKALKLKMNWLAIWERNFTRKFISPCCCSSCCFSWCYLWNYCLKKS